MIPPSQIESSRLDLSGDAQVLSDSSSAEFQAHLKRWSNINLQTPAAIVLPKTESDCLKSVRWAISTGCQFVTKSGGMSLYSTTNDNGIVIDLSDFASITHDPKNRQATLIGGITTKAVAVELAKDGFCTVGAIPFFINGGSSPLVSKIGYASDNILSARVITAQGDLLAVSEDENADLLYAIRGAGQSFGLVVSLTVRTYPVSTVFGNDRGQFWSGRFVFPFDRAEEVAKTMQSIVNDSTFCTGGLIMAAAPSPARQPAIFVTAKLIHPNSEHSQEEAFKPLYDLGPLMSGGALIPIENNGDALQPLMAPGDFKKLRLTAIHSYVPSTIPEIARLWHELITTCPDAKASISAILWESQSPVQPKFDSANSMHSLRLWANNLTWCTESASQSIAQSYLDKVIAVTREGQKPEEYVDFANSLREPESPVDRRYNGAERLEKLRVLKARWDPAGVFGREFL